MTLTQSLTQQIEGAFATANDGHGRSQQALPGLSELRQCERSFAWKLAGVERDEQPLPDALQARYRRAAMIGTWVHAGLLPHVAAAFIDAADELPVTFEGVNGTADLYARSAALVLDVKTCSQYAYERVLSDGARVEHVDQLHGYAGALLDAGLPVERLAIVYVNRGSAELTVVEMDVDEQRIAELRGWIADTRSYVERWHEQLRNGDDVTLRDVPRGERRRGPGHDLTCDSCPFRRRCWGDAEPAQQVLIRDGSVSVDAALQLYADAQQREKQAGADKAFARDVLAVVEPGTYSTHKLTRTAERVQLYPRKVDELLLLAAERGVPEWELVVERKVAASLRVTPVKAVAR